MKHKILHLTVLFLVIVIFGHVSDCVRYLLIDFGFNFLYVLHEGVDPINLTQGDDELVPLLQIAVDVVGEVWVS